MLYFEIANDGKAIQVSFDEEGAQALVAAIKQVEQAGAHKHLCAPSCGGKELSDQTLSAKKAICEVILAKIER
jgi:hypothetical protein